MHCIRNLFLALALATTAACTGTAPETPMAASAAASVSATSVPGVNLRAVMDTITRGMIADSTNDYKQPWSTAMNRFQQAVDSVYAGRLDAADALLDPYFYDVYRVRDVVTGDTVVIFRERLYLNGKVRLGWGTYIYNPRHQARVDVHVNHPISDQHTEDIGIELYRDGRYRWFLVAGAERDANPQYMISDVAHYSVSMFHTMSEKLVAPNVRAISIHGFRESKHTLPAGVDQVISNGTGTGYTAAFGDLRTRLQNAGWVAGLFGNTPGYNELGGTTNRQGAEWRDRAGLNRWMHLEVERNVRDDPAAWRAMNATLRAWTAAHPL